MAWKVEKRAIVEAREFPNSDGPVQHVIGEVGRRHCGCYWILGMRLDVNEVTFGVGPCEMHEAQTRRAYETVTLMPPQDIQMSELYQQQLEAELI